MPVPVETLRAEKYVGDAGDSASGERAAAAQCARARSVDPAAADGAPIVSGGLGTRATGECVGDGVSAGRLVWVSGDEFHAHGFCGYNWGDVFGDAGSRAGRRGRDWRALGGRGERDGSD